MIMLTKHLMCCPRNLQLGKCEHFWVTLTRKKQLTVWVDLDVVLDYGLDQYTAIGPGGWGVDPLKYVGGSEYVLTHPKMSHSFIQNCCWITLQVSHHQ